MADYKEKKDDDLAAIVRDDDDEMFPTRKKQKKCERSLEEIAMIVENIVAELEVAAEYDAELNRLSKPATSKLKKLSFLRDSLSKKYLQQELLDHGVLCVLKTWLEPLPDGSFPNVIIRAMILQILTEYPIDLDREDRREQLKKSGLGKVIMFLSKSEEEAMPNRKMATSLVHKWSRSIFGERFEGCRRPTSDFNNNIGCSRPGVEKKPRNKYYQEDDNLDLVGPPVEEECRSAGVSRKQVFASRPEPMLMQFVVRPPSKINVAEVNNKVVPNETRLKMLKKVQRMNGSKRKCLQAAKLSAQGRGLVSF